MATTVELKQLIIDELGVFDDDIVSSNIDLWWSLFTAKGSTWDYLQYLYTKRHVIQYLMVKSRALIDIKIGMDTFNESQEFRNLSAIMTLLNDEIQTLDPRAPVLGVMTPTSTIPDAFDEIYQRVKQGLPSRFAVPLTQL